MIETLLLLSCFFFFNNGRKAARTRRKRLRFQRKIAENRRLHIFGIYSGKISNRGLHYTHLNKHMPTIRCYLYDGDDEFKRHFRLTRYAFNKLTQTIFPQQRRKHHGWHAEIEVLVFCFWLACGACYRVVYTAFDIPKSTVHRIVHKLLRFFNSHLHQFVFLPRTFQQVRQIGRGFSRMGTCALLEMAAGAIDGCHLRLHKVLLIHKTCYLNYKKFLSIHLQGVVDDLGLFIDTFIGFPGSAHDSRVLRHSRLYRSRRYPPDGFYLLGDGGYPSLATPIAIVTPFRKPVRNDQERQFNKKHSKARSRVERTFGEMKQRFRCVFDNDLRINLKEATYVVAACVSLHNFCRRNNDRWGSSSESSDSDDSSPSESSGDDFPPNVHGETNGDHIRQAITNQL